MKKPQKYSADVVAKVLFTFLDNASVSDLDTFEICLSKLAARSCTQGNIGKSAFLYSAISAINKSSIKILEEEIKELKHEISIECDRPTKEDLRCTLELRTSLEEYHANSDRVSTNQWNTISSDIPIL
jgi:hypothetical protein